jgi:hypothetical protein
MTPNWVHLADLSLAAAIATGGAYSMFRLFASTEAARRAQMTDFVKILTDQMVKRQDDQAAAINALRDAVLLLRDELRDSRRREG